MFTCSGEKPQVEETHACACSPSFKLPLTELDLLPGSIQATSCQPIGYRHVHLHWPIKVIAVTATPPSKWGMEHNQGSRIMAFDSSLKASKNAIELPFEQMIPIVVGHNLMIRIPNRFFCLPTIPGHRHHQRGVN